MNLAAEDASSLTNALVAAHVALQGAALSKSLVAVVLLAAKGPLIGVGPHVILVVVFAGKASQAAWEFAAKEHGVGVRAGVADEVVAALESPCASWMGARKRLSDFLCAWGFA